MVIELNEAAFREKVFDFGDGGDVAWKYTSDTPSIIKFGAEWCSPCKTIDPIFEELSNDYADRINMYKIDVDKEQALAQMFNVQSIPSILFIPTGTELPQMSMGAIPKDVFESAIKDVLKVEK